MYSYYDTMARQSQDRGDRHTRNRYRTHQTSMNRMAGDPKWATRRGPYTPGWGGGGEAPTMGAAPTLEMPEYDEGKVSALTQKKSATGVRNLRNTTQRAMSETYDNPNVKRMTVRDALAGYGSGLESVMSGAGSDARAEYDQQYSTSVNAAMSQYEAELNRQAMEYNTASNAWLMEQGGSDPYEDFENFYA